MEIRQHKTSPNHLIISEPTPEALKVAKRLEAGNWAKVQPSGNIVAHVKVRAQFDDLLPKEPVQPTPVAEVVAPEFTDRNELIDWLYENMNNPKIAWHIKTSTMNTTFWNERHAGKTAKEIEERFSKYVD